MTARRSLFLPLFLLCLSLCSHAQQQWSGILAPTRAIDWSNAGVSGGIPSGAWTQCGSTIAPYGTSGSPKSPNAINAVIAACGNNTYVLLGAGTFYLTAGPTISQSNVVLRGSGADPNTGTVLMLYGENSCSGVGGAVCIWNGDGNYDDGVDNAANWTAGYAQGATTITLGPNTTGSTPPFVGQTLILDQLKDGTTRAQDTGNIFVCSTAPACTQSNGGNGRPSRNQQQLVKITAISGGSCNSGCTVTISPGLYLPNWRSSQSPQAWWGNTANVAYVGIENMRVDTSNDGGNVAAGGNGILFVNAENSWVKDVAAIAKISESLINGSSGCTYRRIEGYQAHNLTIRDSYLLGRKCFDDYGIDFWEGGDSLIENNIIQWMGTPMMCENCQGNVFSANYVPDNYWGFPPGTWLQASVYHHGSEDCCVLSENNIGLGMQLENYFGQAFLYTAFRNRFFGYQPGAENQSVPGFLYGLNRYNNVVANVLGTSGFHNTYITSATGNTTDSGPNCNTSIYAIGLGSNCGNGDNQTWPYNDTATQSTEMLWGNYDVVNAGNRFVASENGSGAPAYPGLANPSSTFPPSFLYSSAPSWWPSNKPWPIIGPDVTGGNIGVCSGGTYDRWPATAASQCTGGTLASGGINGEAYSNPAMDCYLVTLNGPPNGSGNALPFDGNVCYTTSQSAAPAPPTGLNAQVQ